MTLSANLRAFQNFMEGIWEDDLPECRIHTAVQFTPEIKAETSVPVLVDQPEVKTCERCGADFTQGAKETNHLWARRRFCSRRCVNLSVHKTSPETIKEIQRICREEQPPLKVLAVRLGMQASTITRYAHEIGYHGRDQGGRPIWK